MGRSGVWKLSATSWHPEFQKTCPHRGIRSACATFMHNCHAQLSCTTFMHNFHGLYPRMALMPSDTNLSKCLCFGKGRIEKLRNFFTGVWAKALVKSPIQLQACKNLLKSAFCKKSFLYGLYPMKTKVLKILLFMLSGCKKHQETGAFSAKNVQNFYTVRWWQTFFSLTFILSITFFCKPSQNKLYMKEVPSVVFFYLFWLYLYALNHGKKGTSPFLFPSYPLKLQVVNWRDDDQKVFLLLPEYSLVGFFDLRHVVGGVYASPLGIESRDLALVVVDELDGLGLEVAQRARLREGGHLVGLVTLGRLVKSYT